MSRIALAQPLPRRPGWDRLTGEHYHLFVIGGGVHGLGVAREAALRGLRVAVIERNDWASGTSSRSSKLMHGGLRYLRQGALGFVRESLEERDLHLRLAGEYVHRVTVRVPRPPRGAVPHWQVRAGILLYDTLARRWGASAPFASEPSYIDGTLDDARFCLALLRDVRDRGGQGLHYTEWAEWVRQGDRIVGARVRDRLSGEDGWVSADHFVNAAGPWADGLIGSRGSGPRLRLTRGTHVVLDRRVDSDARLFFSPEDGRSLFLLPYEGGCSLLGTTDLDERTPATEPIPTREEVSYLARALGAQFPEWRHWRAVGLQCGLRPLLDAEGDPSSLSREERIETDPTGSLVSILGGKYTTYRRVAERVLDRVMELRGAGQSGHPSRTAAFPPAPPRRSEGERIARAFSEEDAVRLEDVFLRRTTLGHRGGDDEKRIELAAKAWRLRWGQGDAATRAEVDAYRDLQRRRLSALDAWPS